MVSVHTVQEAALTLPMLFMTTGCKIVKDLNTYLKGVLLKVEKQCIVRNTAEYTENIQPSETRPLLKYLPG